jgi:hypothetical protein
LSGCLKEIAKLFLASLRVAYTIITFSEPLAGAYEIFFRCEICEMSRGIMAWRIVSGEVLNRFGFFWLGIEIMAATPPTDTKGKDENVDTAELSKW